MTATTATTTGTELAQVAPGVLSLVKGHEQWTVADLADKLAAPVKELPVTEPFPKLPKPVTFANTLKAALHSLPKVFGKFTPTERRKLESAELSALTEEALAISAAAKPMAERLKAIQEIVRHHMDFVAEDRGLAGKDTKRVASGVAKGHYLVAAPEKPFEVGVEGYEGVWQQRYTSGGTAQDQTILEKLEAEGTITRKEYLDFTSEVRVLNQEKIAAAIRRNPERALQILAAITTRSAPGASLYAPKK